MLTSVRSLLAASVLAGSVLAAAPALAQDDASGITLSANATIVSEYRFRGVGLSGGDPAIQGGFDLSTEPGFYIGTWASSIEGGAAYGEMELDLYAGWSGDLTEGLGADVGVLYYAYPANDVGPSDYWELYASLSPTVGPAEFEFGIAYAPDQDSLGNTDNLYLYGDVGVGIPGTPLTLSAHLGYTDGFLTFTGNGKALDYSLGAELAVNDNFTIGVSYVGVEDDGLNLKGVTDDTVVFSIGASF